MHIINPMRHALSIAVLISLIAGNLQAAVFTVTTTTDNGNNVTPTAGSLRAAIVASNAAGPGPNTINFNIAGTGPFTIAPPVDLPNITVPVTINGYSQPGSSVNTLAQGDNAVLQIILNGSNYTVGDALTTGNGLHFDIGSDGSIVRGLVINQWIDNGILIDTTSANITGVSIIGNFIGTDVTGTIVMPNRAGIGLSSPTLFDAIGTIIGTPAFADRNIIAGSLTFREEDNYGLRGGCISSFFGINSVIQNNYIGTDKTGTISLGNSLIGLYIAFDSGTTIGGALPTMRNIISGHLVFGMRMRGCSTCTIQGNYIGTDISGTVALGNSNAGIEFDDDITASGGSVGTSVIGNLISGNGTGIRLGDNQLPGNILNTIQNNNIGTDANGTRALGNTRFGIEVDDAQNTVTGNIISGNLGGGLLIYSVIGTSTTVTGNKIGTDITGTKSIPNIGNGIQIGLDTNLSAPTNNTIGA